MGIGLGIFLLAIGAVLAFAVHATVVGLDIHVVGWILMAAGVLSLLFTLLIFAPRRRRTTVQTQGPVTAAPVLGSSVLPQNVVTREVHDDL